MRVLGELLKNTRKASRRHARILGLLHRKKRAQIYAFGGGRQSFSQLGGSRTGVEIGDLVLKIDIGNWPKSKSFAEGCRRCCSCDCASKSSAGEESQEGDGRLEPFENLIELWRN